MTEEKYKQALTLSREKGELDYLKEGIEKDLADGNYLEVLRKAGGQFRMVETESDIFKDVHSVYEKLAKELYQRVEQRISEIGKEFSEL